MGDAAAGRAGVPATSAPRAGAGLAVARAEWSRCRSRRARAGFFAGAVWAAAVAPDAEAAPYMNVPVAWTTPGLIVIPVTVA